MVADIDGDGTDEIITGGDTILIMPDLGFGKCELVVAVPDAWMDVDSMADLADLAVEFRESGREGFGQIMAQSLDQMKP